MAKSNPDRNGISREIGRCADCRYWGKYGRGDGWSDCRREMVTDDLAAHPLTMESIGDIWTAPEHGCAEFEPKTSP